MQPCATIDPMPRAAQSSVPHGLQIKILRILCSKFLARTRTACHLQSNCRCESSLGKHGFCSIHQHSELAGNDTNRDLERCRGTRPLIPTCVARYPTLKIRKKDALTIKESLGNLGGSVS